MLLVYSQVCSVCGLHAGFHMAEVEAENENDSVLADGDSKASSLDEMAKQYEHDGDEDGDITASLAAVIAPGVAVAIAKHASDWEADGGPATNHDDTPTPTRPLPGSVI